MEKKVYNQPMTQIIAVAPQSIICVSPPSGGGIPINGEGSFFEGD